MSELERIEDLTTDPPSVFYRPADAAAAVDWRTSADPVAASDYNRLLRLLFESKNSEAGSSQLPARQKEVRTDAGSPPAHTRGS
jgi:hypothetical protein